MESPSSTEKVIRFGCGFFFGVIVIGLGGARAFYYRGDSFLAFILIAALIFGLAAMRYGDSFWRALKNFGTWWV